MTCRLFFGVCSVVVTAVSTSLSYAKDGFAGPYLAARQAIISADYEDAAFYYRRALAVEPQNLPLMENAILAMISKGDMKEAIRISQQHVNAGAKNSVSDIILDAAAMSEGNFSRNDRPTEGLTGIAPLVAGLIHAWSLQGQGKMSNALAAFDEVAKTEDFSSFAHYHRALALASVGDFENANKIFSGETYGPLTLSVRGIEAHAQILAQLDRRDDAIELLEATVEKGFSRELEDLLRRLKKGETVEYSFIKNARDGAAEVYFNIGAILNGRSTAEHVLLYMRLAQFLRPTHAPAILTAAEILEDLKQFDLATKTYANVPTDQPAYILAELGRANALYSDERKDAAAEVLKTLSKNHADVALVHSAMGDMLAQMEKDKDAIEAYTQAIALRSESDESLWRIYYARGIIHERLKNFPEMEKDFRKALDLSPNQPDVLNYLGYSLVEQRIKLDEALKMIETAVKERPDSGYIADSLGWVFYRLGRFEEAVAPIEKAAELLPVDPIVNDHLGDAYWMVGREREAEFQWKRALSFEPEEEDAKRIRAKLEHGLDKVLKDEENASNTQTAQD